MDTITIQYQDDTAKNCGVVAVAHVVGRPVDEMMEIFRRRFKFGPRWVGGTNIGQLIKVLDDHKRKYQLYEAQSRGSLKNWVNWYARRDTAYIVRVGNHFLYVKGGVAHDQCDVAPVESHWAKSKRVSHIIEIKS